MAAWALLMPMLELGGGEDKMKVFGGLLTAGETEHETCGLSTEDNGCEDDEELCGGEFLEGQESAAVPEGKSARYNILAIGSRYKDGMQTCTYLQASNCLKEHTAAFQLPTSS